MTIAVDWDFKPQTKRGPSLNMCPVASQHAKNVRILKVGVIT